MLGFPSVSMATLSSKAGEPAEMATQFLFFLPVLLNPG